LNNGDELTVGNNKIVAILDSNMAVPNGVPNEEPDEVPNEVAAELPDDDSVAAEDSFAAENTFESFEPEPSQGYVYDSHAGDDDPGELSDYEYLDTPFGNEEIDLLRSEIELLQSELSQRDAELLNVREQMLSTCDVDEPADDEEVVRLVNRLEELLDELKSSDDRVLTLEEFLRASDEANQAEQEERRQLESWVAEIEQRVSAREAESAAEISRLQGRNKETQNQLRRAEAQIRKMAQPSSNDSSAQSFSNEAIQGLRQQNEEMSRQLQALNEENEALRKEISDNQSAGSSEEVRSLEQKLAQLELDASRERADLARQRAEIERAKDEIQQKLVSGTVSDSDCRFAAMRQHLRELHEADELEREEKRQRSLSGRIARLLGRVGSP
jgi:chromosome segregation ATPase